MQANSRLSQTSPCRHCWASIGGKTSCCSSAATAWRFRAWEHTPRSHWPCRYDAAYVSKRMKSRLIQVGIAAMHSRMCDDPSCTNSNCPVSPSIPALFPILNHEFIKQTCDADMHTLAQGLPWSHAMNSHLVCRISGDMMDEHNPPLMLPNGRVYSRKAWRECHGI